MNLIITHVVGATLLHLTDRCTNHRISSHSQDAETHDHQDHTFSGIMFPILARPDGPPIDYLEISTVWVRGSLGPLTVWVTSGTWAGKHEEEHLWTKVHESEQPPSFRKLGRSACPRRRRNSPSLSPGARSRPLASSRRKKHSPQRHSAATQRRHRRRHRRHRHHHKRRSRSIRRCGSSRAIRSASMSTRVRSATARSSTTTSAPR